MGLVAGGFLRLTQTFIYFLALCTSAIVLGFYSYFLAVLSDRDEPIKKVWKAVEGISGVACVYTICAVVLTCCLGGISFFAFFAVVMNLLLMGGMIAVAVLTRDGAHHCRGYVNTPLGSGYTNQGSGFGDGFGTSGNDHVTYQVSYGTACHYNQASFICSVIGAFLFLVLAAFQIVLVRNRKKENRYGPSPANNYTSGSGRRRFWNRRREAEAGVVGAGALAAEHHHHDHERGIRPSNDTAFTGSTMAGGNTLAKDEPARY